MIQTRANGKKSQFGQFIDDFEVKYLQIGIFFDRFHSNWSSYLILSSGKKTTARWGRFWEKYNSVWFWAYLETFSRISRNQEFFSEIRLSEF